MVGFFGAAATAKKRAAMAAAIFMRASLRDKNERPAAVTPRAASKRPPPWSRRRIEDHVLEAAIRAAGGREVAGALGDDGQRVAVRAGIGVVEHDDALPG